LGKQIYGDFITTFETHFGAAFSSLFISFWKESDGMQGFALKKWGLLYKFSHN